MSASLLVGIRPRDIRRLIVEHVGEIGGVGCAARRLARSGGRNVREVIKICFRFSALALQLRPLAHVPAHFVAEARQAAMRPLRCRSWRDRASGTRRP